MEEEEEESPPRNCPPLTTCSVFVLEDECEEVELELELEDELMVFSPDLLSFIFREPPLLLPVDLEEERFLLLLLLLLLGSALLLLAVVLVFVVCSRTSSSAVKSLKVELLLSVVPEEDEEEASPTPPTPRTEATTLDEEEFEFSALGSNLSALTDTLQGVMSCAREDGSALCRWMCLRSPWGFTAAWHTSQTTTMKGSVSGNTPYSPISTPGIRMTWPRVEWALDEGLPSSGAAGR